MPEENYPIDWKLRKDLESALEHLNCGNQEKAKEAFVTLLRQEPGNIEFQAGFFCAGWWLNRETSTQFYRQGRPLGSWLMEEWKSFAQKIDERGYQNCLSFQKTMHFVLNELASNFRLAFQEEGASSADPKLLKELAICLLQLGDYNNAIDILRYARTKNPYEAQLNFLLGEVLCCRNSSKEDMNRGLSYYRDAFLIDLHITEPHWITSKRTSKLFKELEQKYKDNLEQVLYWFPAYLMAVSFIYSLSQLNRLQIKEIRLEIQRLQKEKERGLEKYRESLHAALSFYLLTLIYQYRSYGSEPGQAYEYEEELKKISPELYQISR